MFFVVVFFFYFFVFFFQAEDGIRDRLVTGVQTCALPICVDYDSHADESSTKKDALPLFDHCNFCRFDT